jgi:DNA-binding GntR family transcriptional regulator
MKEFFTFDRRKKTSIQSQIVEQIIGYILDYKLIHGAVLPNIELTSRELNLTKKEVGDILKTLVQLGYLFFDSKTQMYLVQHPVTDVGFINTISPIAKEIIKSGQTPSVETLLKEFTTATSALSHQSGFTVGEKLVHYRRIVSANERPIFHIDFYLSLEKMPKVDVAFKDHEPHLDIVMSQYPSAYRFHVREFLIKLAPDYIVELLEPKEKGMICNYGTYRFFNQQGQTTEYGVTYLTDLTEFTTISKDLNLLLI